MPTISIELFDGQRAFFAGEVVKGFVHINIEEHIPSKSLVVGLFGQERYLR
jgi:hypothetical protein